VKFDNRRVGNSGSPLLIPLAQPSLTVRLQGIIHRHPLGADADTAAMPLSRCVIRRQGCSRLQQALARFRQPQALVR
jgi:hypothetical protein